MHLDVAEQEVQVAINAAQGNFTAGLPIHLFIAVNPADTPIITFRFYNFDSIILTEVEDLAGKRV